MLLQIAFASYPIALFGVSIAWALNGRSTGRFSLLLDFAASGSIAVFAFLVGAWAFTSYCLRYALLGLFVLAVIASYRRTALGNTRLNVRSAGYVALSSSVLLVFTMLNAAAIASYVGPADPLNLLFPLQAGNYYVIQGGNSVVTNPFHTLSGGKQALDIVRLNSYGNRATGIAPRSLANYEIFGERLYSPCAGTIVTVRGDLPDNDPGTVDTRHPEGNHVIVKCAEAEILMAHLKQGSPVVVAGEEVLAGQFLGKVGNSGNTLEPHLHISAREGKAEKGLMFAGRRLSLNSIVAATQD